MITTLTVLASLYAPVAPADLPAAPPRWETEDFVLGALSGSLGSLVGGALGVTLGAVAAGDCQEDADDSSLLGDCFLHGFGEMALGGFIGMHFGAAAGATIYGHSKGFDGSYGLSLGGAALGSLVGGGLAGGLCATDNDVLCSAGLVLFLGAQGFGAALGYQWGIDEPGERYGALLEFDPAAGVRLGLPGGGMTLQPGGAYAVGLTLAGGRF